jgi:hypothetical protein
MLCYSVGETYFFDRLFYQKSARYGYTENSGQQKWWGTSLGQRSEDIEALFASTKGDDGNILGATDTETFDIAIIGDSYVWGQGVKNSQRFPVILEKKLNKLRPTQIYSLALPGDNLLEHLIKYRAAKESLSIDLYIFVPVQNDALINTYTPYPQTTGGVDEITNRCPARKEAIFDQAKTVTDHQYREMILASWHNPANRCMAETTLSLFPPNSLFFVPDDYSDNLDSYVSYRQIILQLGFSFTSASRGKNMKGYQKYWQEPQMGHFFQISSLEKHPSKLAHQMYADILYQEITSNPQWRFNVP